MPDLFVYNSENNFSHSKRKSLLSTQAIESPRTFYLYTTNLVCRFVVQRLKLSRVLYLKSKRNFKVYW